MLFARRASVKSSWTYRSIAFVARFLMQVFTRRDWRHGEKLDLPGGIIVCANHISNFDPLALAHFLHDNGRPPRFLGKAQLFAVPLIGRMIRAAGQIPVHRGTAAAADALRDAEQALAAGEAVVVYPEGTLTYDPGLWPMTGATGAARLALISQAPIVPVAQWGAQNVIPRWSKGLFLLQRHRMHVIAGDPVDLSDLQDRPLDAALLNEATMRIMRAITDLLEQLRGEPAPAVMWDRRNHREGPEGEAA